MNWKAIARKIGAKKKMNSAEKTSEGNNDNNEDQKDGSEGESGKFPVSKRGAEGEADPYAVRKTDPEGLAPSGVEKTVEQIEEKERQRLRDAEELALREIVESDERAKREIQEAEQKRIEEVETIQREIQEAEQKRIEEIKAIQAEDERMGIAFIAAINSLKHMRDNRDDYDGLKWHAVLTGELRIIEECMIRFVPLEDEDNDGESDADEVGDKG